eukprot:TRINITY_DN4505_c0_g1_i2.p1 TRINITY_DN4505_c0_g1~~TRINITY_DN4505_c0_g1_i2.p1  ORF type:complete len:939 (+),score=313.90 TRINITY_DN4505_c0_g1_i2:443-3259(+)
MVELVSVSTQAPEEAPDEEEFDEEEREPEPMMEVRPQRKKLAAPTTEEHKQADVYDPDKFWGYDIMFQFPWLKIEENLYKRKFRAEKMSKTEREQDDDDELDKLSPRSRKLQEDFSPEMFAARCEAAGLFTSVSSDPEHIYLRVGATWARYEAEAERIGFRKRLKEEYVTPDIPHRDVVAGRYNEPGLADEDPLRRPLPERTLGQFVYAEFECQKRERFANSILSPNSLFSSSERQRLCQSVIEASFVTGGAEIAVDSDSEVWGYVAGAPICLPDYEERDRLERIWHGGRPFGEHPNVFWRLQPFHEIREYYGEAITLYYAWMDEYTRWLVPLSMMGAVCWSAFMLRDLWGPLENALVLYGAFVIFWGIFFMEAWNRREADLVFMWDCLDTTAEAGGFRQHWGFPARAERRRHPVTAEWENYFSPAERQSRMNKSLVIMGFFMLLGLSFNVGAVVLGGWLQDVITFQPFVGPAIAAIALVIAQQVTKLIWEQIATALTNWETHKFTVDYDQQMGFKMFGFELVMKFGAIFFIAFFKGPLGSADILGIQGCKNKDGDLVSTKFCDYELMVQLLIVFLSEMTVGQFSEVVLPMLQLKVKNYLNNKAEEEAALKAGHLEACGSESKSGTGASVGVGLNDIKVDGASSSFQCKESHVAGLDDLGREERQTRMEEFYAARLARGQPDEEWITEDQENEAEKESFWSAGGPNLDYQEMMIQFGFVTLFSMGFPLVPFLALLNNVVEIRTDSMGMNETMQRPQYRRATDIGAWKGSLNFMVWASIIFNLALMLYFNHYNAQTVWFDGTDALTLVSVIIAAEHVIILFKLVCETYIPDRTQWLVDALDGIKGLEKRAMSDSGPVKAGHQAVVAGIGNMMARKEHVMSTSAIKKGAIEKHFKLYPEVKKLRSEVRVEWDKKTAEELHEWKEAIAEEAKKAEKEDEEQ